ncbi:hypothetical protein DITRI_Ditri03aG0190600 [Diplodiscus trichospermus]
MLRRAREANLGTLVVGDWDRALGRHADLWVSWIVVENGEEFDGGSVEGLDGVVNLLVVGRNVFGGVRISLFSEGEEEDEVEWDIEEVGHEDYLLEDSEDEMIFEEDGYY